MSGRYRFNIYNGIALAFMLSCMALNGMAQDFEFASLRGTPVNTTGWTMQGAAAVGNTPNAAGNEEIILTNPINTQSGSIFYNTPINLSQCQKWVAEYEFRIFDGSVADGLAFCYIDVPPAGFVTGGGVGIPASANGLKVVVDTWLNCGTDPVPKLQIRWGAGYNECNGQPTRSNFDGAMSFLRSGTYNKCRIEYEQGNIKVFVNGTEYLSAFQTFDFTGYFGFTASTGGFNDRHSIRNVRIFTEMPPSDAGVSASFCPGASVQLGSTPDPDLVYRWSPGTGLSNMSVANPTLTLDNTGETPLENLTYYVNTSFKDKPGCTSRDSVLITVLANPKPVFTHDTVCMPGGNIQFRNFSRLNGQVQNNLNWSWNFANPNATPANPNTSTLFEPIHNYSTSGPFEVILSATSPQGCTGTLQQNIRPLVGNPTVNIAYTGDTCSGYLLSFTADLDPGGNIPFELSWNFGDGNASAQLQPNHAYNAAGNYTVIAEIDNGYCPPVSTSANINIKASPQLSLNNLPAICNDTPPFLLDNISVINAVSGQGRYEGAGVTGNIFFPQRVTSGTSDVHYTFTGNNGCSSDTTFSIEVYPLPDISAGADQVSVEMVPVQLQGRVGQDGTLFTWSPTVYMDNPAIIQPTVNPPVDTRYVITATSPNGCTRSDSVWVRVLPSLEIPTAFSPNGDGINDKWTIRYLDTYPGSLVRIFDRYGRIVFQSTGYNQPWDGTLKGVPVPVGVYYYIIDPKNGARVRQGSVTVVR